MAQPNEAKCRLFGQNILAGYFPNCEHARLVQPSFYDNIAQAFFFKNFCNVLF